MRVSYSLTKPDRFPDDEVCPICQLSLHASKTDLYAHGLPYRCLPFSSRKIELHPSCKECILENLKHFSFCPVCKETVYKPSLLTRRDICCLFLVPASFTFSLVGMVLSIASLDSKATGGLNGIRSLLGAVAAFEFTPNISKKLIPLLGICLVGSAELIDTIFKKTLQENPQVAASAALSVIILCSLSPIGQIVRNRGNWRSVLCVPPSRSLVYRSLAYSTIGVGAILAGQTMESQEEIGYTPWMRLAGGTFLALIGSAHTQLKVHQTAIASGISIGLISLPVFFRWGTVKALSAGLGLSSLFSGLSHLYSGMRPDP
ncbi:MAG: hypothetical protein V4487_05425 [Chlamydiota bacterium]